MCNNVFFFGICRSFGNAHEIPELNSEETNVMVFGPNKVKELRDKYGYYPYPYSRGKNVESTM